MYHHVIMYHLCECAVSPKDPPGHTWLASNALISARSLAMHDHCQDLIPSGLLSNSRIFGQC